MEKIKVLMMTVDNIPLQVEEEEMMERVAEEAALWDYQWEYHSFSL